MALSKRHKYILTCLLIYWPGLFILTHIPIPQIARQSGMSDKIMHVLAYLVLVFFFWHTISPYAHVSWKKAKVWLILGLMVGYGAIDEYLQGQIGRNADVMDFLSNLAGIALGLAILTVFAFWPGSLAICAIFIYAVTNLSKIAVLYPQMHINITFHFLAYAVFTLLWIQNMHVYFRLNRPSFKWFITALALPLGLLLAVKLSSPLFDKQVWSADYFTAAIATATGVLISWTITLPRCNKTKRTQ
jgi:hypothetical protein